MVCRRWKILLRVWQQQRGGTFDVAAVDVEAGIFEVLATTGDAFLGGDDVDRVVVENLVRDVRSARGFDITSDTVAVERLRLAAQTTKHELSDVTASKIYVPELLQLPSGRAVEYQKPLRRDELEQWSNPLIRRIEAPIKEALKRCGRKREEIEEVLLVGGMTRMPAVRREIARSGRNRVFVNDQPTTLRLLADLAPFLLRIHGQRVRCQAQIHTLGGLSAHGDQDDLLRWYDSFVDRPPVYLVHGEVPSAESLAGKLREHGAVATVSRPGLSIDLANLPALSRD